MFAALSIPLSLRTFTSEDCARGSLEVSRRLYSWFPRGALWNPSTDDGRELFRKRLIS